MKNWSRFLLSSLALLTASVLFAQNEVLLIRGSLKDEETLKKLDGVIITVYQNGNQFDTEDAGSSGKYSIELPLGYSYDLKFSRTDYISKILRFDTRNIPPEDKAGGFQSDVDMKLFPMVEGFNVDIMKEPIGVASFSDLENNILFDFKYTEKMQAKIKDEFDRLMKLASEGDKIKKEYEKLIQEGDQKMVEERYQDAMAKYDGALKLFPKDVPAKTKYDEAKAKYDALLAAQKRDADYQRLIAEGDSYFKSKKWAEAKKSYQDAIAIKKDEKYPKEKLYEIDKMMDQEALRAEYEAAIKEADAKFNSKDYAVSIEKYKAASALIPSEGYPKDQIIKAQAALDQLLSDEARRLQLEKRYKELLDLGDGNLESKNYESALNNFQEASGMKPEEKYPKDKIAEINKILKDLQKKNDLAAKADNAEKERIDREYAEHIMAADKFFSDSKEKSADLLNSARGEYQAALGLKPAEKYPSARIKAIDDLLTRLASENALTAQKDADAKNAERLRQEEEMKKAREEMERLAEEQRKARAEEEERKKKERENAANADAMANKDKGTFLKADNAEEQAVDAYYRKAREIEEAAKYKSVKEKSLAYTDASQEDLKKAEELRSERQDNINSQKDKLTAIHRNGESVRAVNEGEIRRKKEQEALNNESYTERYEVRAGQAEEKIQSQKEVEASISENDRLRQTEISKLKTQQENYAENNSLYQSRGEVMRSSNSASIDRTKQEITDMSHNGEEIRQQEIVRAEEKKQGASEYISDVRSAADVRLSASASKVEDEKKKSESLGAGKEKLTEENIMEVNTLKQNAAMMNLEKENKAAEDRYKTREELMNLNPGKEKTDDEYLPVPGTENLPEGVTETSYEYTRPSRKIIERTVKRGNKVDTYLKVVSKSGIFYFKNGQSITEEMWVRETLRATE